MNYEDRLHAMLNKGTINAEQARIFREGLERLTPQDATLVFRHPISLLKIALGVLALIAIVAALISNSITGGSTTPDSIQNIATAMNQTNATGSMSASATTLISLFLLFSIPVASVFFFMASVYNQLIAYDEDSKKTGAFIVHTLQRRTNLIPQLEKLANQAMQYEETLQHSVAETRANTAHALEQALHETRKNPEIRLLNPLGAALEAYPQLKALDAVQLIQRELSRTEDDLLIARNLYAATVADFNRTTRSVFGSIVARFYNFQTQTQPTTSL